MQHIDQANQYALRIEGCDWMDDLTLEQVWSALKSAYQQLQQTQDLLFITLLPNGEVPAESNVRLLHGQSRNARRNPCPRHVPDLAAIRRDRARAGGTTLGDAESSKDEYSEFLPGRQVTPLPDRQPCQRHPAYPDPAHSQHL